MLWLFFKFSNPERLRLLHLHFFHKFHDRGIWCNGKRRFLDCIIRCITTHGPTNLHGSTGGRVLEVDLGHGLWKLHGRVKEASQRLAWEGQGFRPWISESENWVMGFSSLTVLGPQKKMEIFRKSEKRVNSKCQVFQRTKSCRKGGILA